MALSGTLDTFALPDVLRLLASTEKTGRLRITGDRGSGSVWVDTGQVVATELTSVNALDPTDIEVVFGLLRFTAGSFTFEAEGTAPNAGSPMAMEPVLGAAENMLAEWRSIEEVVPSLEVWAGLRGQLEGADVMIDADRWQVIAAVGSGAQIGAIAETLNLNEINSCRVVKELIELGLIHLIDEPEGMQAVSYEPVEEVDDESSFIDESFADDVFGDAFAESSDDDDADNHAGDDEADAADPVASAEDGEDTDADDDGDESSIDDVFAPSEDDENSSASTVPSLASLAPSDETPIESLVPGGDDADVEDLFAGTVAVDGDDDLNPAEMARQLANLSPKAAKAVAAAAKASTEAERDAALAAVEAEDDSVNRGLLLKFLGSVDS